MFRPALFPGLAAATASIVAAELIRIAPASATLVTTVHLVVNLSLFTLAGVLVARRGGSVWRAGLVAGLVDALLGHPIAFLRSAPPEDATLLIGEAATMTPAELDAAVATVHLLGAVVGAVVSVMLAVVAASIGAWVLRRRSAMPDTTASVSLVCVLVIGAMTGAARSVAAQQTSIPTESADSTAARMAFDFHVARGDIRLPRGVRASGEAWLTMGGTYAQWRRSGRYGGRVFGASIFAQSSVAREWLIPCLPIGDPSCPRRIEGLLTVAALGGWRSPSGRVRVLGGPAVSIEDEVFASVVAHADVMLHQQPGGGLVAHARVLVVPNFYGGAAIAYGIGGGVRFRSRQP